MGDRANVYIHEGDEPGVYIYTHWYGTELPELVSKALQTPRALARRSDVQYLTRIIFEELLTATDSLGGETGWGLSAVVGDGSDRIVDVAVTFAGSYITVYGYEDDYSHDPDIDYDDGYDEFVRLSYN